MNVKDSKLNNLNEHDRNFINGFNEAIERLNDTFENMEGSEIVCCVRCFSDVAEDIKTFIKDYITNDLCYVRDNLISDMLNNNQSLR